jgi:hypothetical protein
LWLSKSIAIPSCIRRTPVPDPKSEGAKRGVDSMRAPGSRSGLLYRHRSDARAFQVVLAAAGLRRAPRSNGAWFCQVEVGGDGPFPALHSAPPLMRSALTTSVEAAVCATPIGWASPPRAAPPRWWRTPHSMGGQIPSSLRWMRTICAAPLPFHAVCMEWPCASRSILIHTGNAAPGMVVPSNAAQQEFQLAVARRQPAKKPEAGEVSKALPPTRRWSTPLGSPHR